MTHTQLEARGRLFTWGLVVLAGCILALAELPSHLVNEYQEWERTGHPGLPDRSTAVSLGILPLPLIAMPLAGVVIDRIGARRTILAGLSTGGAGLVLFALAQGTWILYPAYFLTALGAVMGGWLPVMAGVCRRFHSRRAMAIALANTVGEFWKVIPFGAFTEFFTWSISPDDGWTRWNILTVSMGLAFVAVALTGYAVLTLRTRDTDPLPDSQPLDDETAAEPSVAPAGADFTALQALRSRAFRLIAAGNAIAAMATTSTIFFLALMMSDRGHPVTSIAYVVSCYTVVLFCSTLAAGYVGNRYSLPRGLAIFIGVQAAGLTLLAFADGLALTFLAVAALAIGEGGRTTLSVTILANHFGTSSLGKILGWSAMMVILATAFGIPLLGWAFDRLTSYTVVILTLAGLSLLSALCFLGAWQPSTPQVEPAPLLTPLS